MFLWVIIISAEIDFGFSFYKKYLQVLIFYGDYINNIKYKKNVHINKIKQEYVYLHRIYMFK